jgi:rsbT co-antagonist protein RsbR
MQQLSYPNLIAHGEDAKDVRDFVQRLIDAMPGYISVFEVTKPGEYRLSMTNEASLQAGFTDKYSSIGMSLFEISGPENAAFLMKNIEQCIENNKPYQNEYQIEIPDQGMRWMMTTYTALRNEAGEATHILMAWEDITERKLEEQAIQEHQWQIIARQAEQLDELSTPLLSISDEAMIMPLVGAIDSRRVQHIMDNLLNGISERQAQIVILDITGVPIVDSQVADSLIRASQAVRLLGAQVVLTGIRPEVAQTLVGLGIDLSSLIIKGTLQDGIKYAFRNR